MTGTIYVVQAVDTEGPLYESLEATFERIYEQYGLEFDPSWKTIEEIRAGKHDLGTFEDGIQTMLRKDQLEAYKQTWDQISEMHETVMSPKWRATMPDSFGHPYVVSWFCMDHVDYKSNPRRRSMGFHSVYEHYRAYLKHYQPQSDDIYWHYHPPAFCGDAHHMGRGFTVNLLHNEILSRRIIDHQWFPVCNRAGGHDETFDINVWLEKWMPFDLSSQNKENDPGKDLEYSQLVPGRYSDWRGAPTNWRVYHPDLYDYRKEGNLKRWMGRCLNMNARYSPFLEDDMHQACKMAAQGQNVLVSVTNHDFRDMIGEITNFATTVRSVADQYKDQGVTFAWANPVEAFRGVLNLEKESPPKFECEFTETTLRIRSDKDIWGIQPFYAMKTLDGRYLHDDLIIDSPREWAYSFDHATIRTKALEKIGFACNDKTGTTTVMTLDLNKPDTWTTHHWNEDHFIDTGALNNAA